jgi:L-threonylcarbamoyladenylate synthase
LVVQTKVLTVETAEQFRSAAEQAVKSLKAGEVVALPTETVYGLAADALDEKAVERIFHVKGRPAHNPVIVHVSSLSMAQKCVANWTSAAEKLAQQFWPGPLTIVLPRAAMIPDIVVAGGETVGVRFPLHPFMRKVIEACAFPLAAPSANIANQLSPTTAQHVFEQLNGKIPLIVDAGPTSVGIESTVVDLTEERPRILRPGMVSAQQISRALGVETVLGPSPTSELRSPGLLEKHYSPRARLMIASWKSAAELQALAEATGNNIEVIHILAYDQIPEANPYGRVAIIPNDADAYARAIYAELHRSDDLGAKLIVVERPPTSPEWEGIHDRLTRASA